MIDDHSAHVHQAPDERTWKIVGVEPIFMVANALQAKAHYERLGFRTSEYDEHYAFAERGPLVIHLAEPDPANAPGAGHLYMHVDDADVLADEWRKAGAVVVGPEDFDYGKREGSHIDPDGNKIRFGSPLREHAH